MHPFAEGNVSAARIEIAKCVELLKAAVRSRRDDEWALVSKALGAAVTAQAQLEDAQTLDEMTTGEELRQ